MKTLFTALVISVSFVIFGTAYAGNSEISELANENVEILMNSRISPYNWIPIRTICGQCGDDNVPSCLWDPEGNDNYCVPGICPSCGAEEGRYCFSVESDKKL